MSLGAWTRSLHGEIDTTSDLVEEHDRKILEALISIQATNTQVEAIRRELRTQLELADVTAVAEMCLLSRSVVTDVSLAPLFRLSGIMSQYHHATANIIIISLVL
jgi:hypothetical protein